MCVFKVNGEREKALGVLNFFHRVADIVSIDTFLGRHLLAIVSLDSDNKRYVRFMEH